MLLIPYSKIEVNVNCLMFLSANALFITKNIDIKFVCTLHFWNNLHYVRSKPNNFEWPRGARKPKALTGSPKSAKVTYARGRRTLV